MTPARKRSRALRPAETTGGLAGIATAVCALLGADTTTVAVVGTVAGALPAAVTFLVEHGGLQGIWRTILGGRRS